MSPVYNSTVSASKKSFWAKTKEVLLTFVCHSAPVEIQHVYEVREKEVESQSENVNRISNDSGYTSVAEQERLHVEEVRAARQQLREEERVRLEAQKKHRDDYERELQLRRQEERVREEAAREEGRRREEKRRREEHERRERMENQEKMRQAQVEAEANRRRLAEEAEEKRVQEKLRQSMLLMEEQNALVAAHQRMEEVNKANAMHERMMAMMAAANAEVEKAAKRGC
ncbi:hypothetical protein G7K_4099-t1 [Saitoella complicata NRRL Y-17804]|uniref:Uncharacterized protein n=1 Tax=Saitoella complicata (strain BCRC 22490 / CBS 7301 / JCM 7358 / NBRC 10748 / NRRL Y-17804) TaxID=698492 RepID=A0A0E9NJE4_SAICN|nr:hypothetical protein G7K_4099-t1 [Saitoella complicata NRRL Y-17804]